MTFAEAAMIMMSGGGSGVIKPLTVTVNGKYSAADHGCDGFDPVDIKVPDRYEDGLTDGRKSLLDFEDGKAPSKEVQVPNGTLVIDNALDEADFDLAMSMMIKYDKYASGKWERFPNRIYSLSVEPHYSEDWGVTYDWLMGHFTEINSDGTAYYHHQGIISSISWWHDGDSWFTSVGYDPTTNRMILGIETIHPDGTTKKINDTWSADVFGPYFRALLNGVTVGGLPHT